MDASDRSGSAIELCQTYPEFDAPVFAALNCVFGGYKEKSSRNRDYCMIRSGTNAQVRLCNSIVSANHQLCRTEDGDYSATGVWFYSEDDMTNFVYDVTSNNVASSVVSMLYRTNLSYAPKMFRPLGTNSVLYGAGVRVLHDADWKNISWKYDYQVRSTPRWEVASTRRRRTDSHSWRRRRDAVGSARRKERA